MRYSSASRDQDRVLSVRNFAWMLRTCPKMHTMSVSKLLRILQGKHVHDDHEDQDCRSQDEALSRRIGGCQSADALAAAVMVDDLDHHPMMDLDPFALEGEMIYPEFLENLSKVALAHTSATHVPLPVIVSQFIKSTFVDDLKRRCCIQNKHGLSRRSS
jgi:hypothetical protein